jgi:hypothetical protein
MYLSLNVRVFPFDVTLSAAKGLSVALGEPANMALSFSSQTNR